VAAYSWPGLTLATLVLFFAAFVFVDGIFDVFHAFGGCKENESWWVLPLEGLLGIAFGVITWIDPMATGVLKSFRVRSFGRRLEAAGGTTA
jgi:uncharacterized membrane protein HdeD (DUF308 family)